VTYSNFYVPVDVGGDRTNKMNVCTVMSSYSNRVVEALIG